MELYKILLFELYAFIFLVPLIPFRTKISVIPISVDTIIGGLFVVTYFAYIVFNRKVKSTLLQFVKTFFKTKLGVSILIYVIICAISLLAAANKAIGIAELVRFLEYPFFFCFIIWEVKDKHIVNAIFRVFTCSILITLICGIIQAVLLTTAGGREIVQRLFYSESQVYGSRVYSTFVNPNYWGAFVNLILFIYAFGARSMEKNIKNLYYIIAGLALVNLILTQTIGSWAAFFITVLLILIFKKSKYIKIILMTVFLCAVALAVVPPIRDSMSGIIEFKLWTGSERLILWITALLMFKDHPILGVGVGNYSVRYYEYIQRFPELYIGRSTHSTHNSYIKVLSETGIPGVAAFLMIIYSLGRELVSVYKNSNNAKIKNYALGVMAGGLTFIIQNFTNNLFFIPQVNIFFWMSIALVLTSHKITEEVQYQFVGNNIVSKS